MGDFNKKTIGKLKELGLTINDVETWLLYQRISTQAEVASILHISPSEVSRRICKVNKALNFPIEKVKKFPKPSEMLALQRVIGSLTEKSIKESW